MTSTLATRVATPATRVATRTRGWRWAVGAGAFGFLATFAGSWVPSLWGDEAASIMSAERSLPSLLAMLRNIDAVHGVYYVFLHFWIQLFGASTVSVRLPSAIAAGVLVAGAFVLARMLVGRNFALVAAVITAVLPRTSYFGADARSYAFSTAIGVWLTVLLLVLLRHRFASQRSARLAWLGYAVGFAIGLWVFLYLGLLLIVHAVYVFSSRRDAAVLWRFVRAAGLAVVLASPLLALGYLQRKQIAFLANRNYATPKSVLVSQWFGSPWLAGAGWALMAIAIGVAVWRWRRGTERTRGIWLIVLWALLPTATLLALNVITPAYNLRYVSASVPAVAILITAGIWALRGRAVHVILAAALVALALPTDIVQRSPFTKDGGSDLAQASAIIGAEATPGDAIVFDRTTLPSQRPRMGLHLYPSDYVGLQDVALKTSYLDRSQLWDTTYPLDEVTTRLGGIHRVWVVEIAGSTDNVDGTDLQTLKSLGYVVQSTQLVHRSIIYSLTRNA